MATNTGITPVIAPIDTPDSLDTFPTGFANKLKGGYKTVSTLVERDAIPSERKQIGDLVKVQETGLIYHWDGTTFDTNIKNYIGLNNVDNTSDINKPISNATQTALNAKLNISEAVTVGTSLGIYNVDTNTYTNNDGTSGNLSATPQVGLTNGSYYSIVNSGNISFSGLNFTSGVQFNTGDLIVVYGTQWGRTPLNSTDLQARKRIDNIKDSIISNKVNYQFESAGLSVVRYNYNGSTTVTSTQFPQLTNLKISDTNTVNDDYVTIIDTGISVANITKAILNIKVLSNNTENPAIGLGFGTTSSAIGFLARKDGSVLRTNNYVAGTIKAEDSNLAFIANDNIQVEINPVSTGVSIRTIKGDNNSGYQLSQPTLNNNLLIIMRGSANFEITLDGYYSNDVVTDINNRLTIAESNVSSNASSISEINDIVNTTSILSTNNVGVSTIVTGTAMSVGNTRIDNLYQLTGTSSLILDQLQVGVEAGGTGKIKFFTKTSGDAYIFVKEVNVTFTTGINTFATETFGTNYNLPVNCYISFYSATATFSGVVASVGNSKFLSGDITTNQTFTDSAFNIQFKATYRDVSITTVKQDVSGINAIVKYNVETVKNSGVSTITAGTSGGTLRTRIDKVNVITGLGTIVLNQFQIGCEVAGSAKVKFFTKNNDGTFNFIKEFSVTLVTGTNTFTSEDFGTFTLFNNCYVGVYVSDSTAFSSVIGATNGLSGLLYSEATGSNIAFTDSQHIIQYKINYSDIVAKNLKQDVDSLNKKVLYVSKSGSDSNLGTKTSTFLTIQKAINAALGQGAKIIVGAGDYRETLDFSFLEFENIELVTEHNSIVRILGSQQLVSWTKTSGKTNIYQCTFSGTIPTWNHPPSGLPFIFEDLNPSKSVTANEIHPLQKGLNYRLPYTEIQQITFTTDLATTLTNLDSSAGKFYLDGTTLYIHTSNSSNPSTNGFSYEIPVRPANIVPANTNKQCQAKLEMNRIKFYFPNSGFISSGFQKVTRHECSIFGVVDIYGGWRDDASIVLSYFDEAGGCANDGFNQHFDAYYSGYTSQNIYTTMPHQIYFNPWSHDNKDDGMSCHFWGKCTVYGGLMEYNGDGGIIPASGGMYVCHNVLARQNNWNSDSSQCAFGTANGATGTGKNATTLEAYNCIAENNKFGFAGKAPDQNNLILTNCISRFNTSIDYYIGHGTMITYNCKVENTSSSKYLLVGTDGVHINPVLTNL